MRTSDYWTLDRSLLWLATADGALVDDAGPNGTRAWTWLTYRGAVAEGDVPEMTYGVNFAEAVLLRMLRDGDAEVMVDGEPVDRVHLQDVQIASNSELEAILVRVEAVPYFQTEEYRRHAVTSYPVRVLAKSLLAVHGWAEADLPTKSDVQVVATPTRNAGSRGLYARLLLERAFGGSLPPPNSMKPVDLYRLVASHVLKSDNAVLPGIETILREVGWRS